jgi:MFS family permease
VPRASTSQLAADETQVDDTSPSLTLEGGALVPDSKPADHPTVVLAVLCTAQFLSALDVFIVNVALRKIGVGVGASSLSDLSWVLNAYAIVIAALVIPAGRIADLFGRKRGFLLGLGVFVVASVGAASSSSLSMLIAFRMLQPPGAPR